LILSPLEQLYSDHHGMVFRTAYRLTGNAADAEDAMQTVFLRLISRSGDAAPIAQAESYLRRAAIHASLDLLRRRQSQQESDTEGGPAADVPAPGTTDPELRHALRQAIGRLEPRHAEMFVLRFFEGHDNGEIANLMGVSKLVVAVTLFRTRQRLRKEWESDAAEQSKQQETTSGGAQ
jgi:RNA polymerase sigma-70 factor (ECF subfamily)